MLADKLIELSRIKLKILELDSPSLWSVSIQPTQLPVDFHTWLWRYTCVLILISMLWHRRAIFDVKGDKLSSCAECRIRTQGLGHPIASRLNVHWLTDWVIGDRGKKKLELDSPSLWVVNWPLHWLTSHGESCKALWNELYVTSVS